MAKTVKKKLTQTVLVWFYGRHDSGKTATMKKVAELVRTGCSKFIEHRVGTDSVFACQYGNYRMGINTRGDDPKAVAAALERFLRMRVDICVVCARPHFLTWQKKITSKLSPLSQAKFSGIDVIEVPRWIVGSTNVTHRCKGVALITTSAEDLFYLLIRLMKSGLPRKWPEGTPSGGLSGFYWNLNEKGVW